MAHLKIPELTHQTKQRFFDGMDASTDIECWNWRRALSKKGYGVFGIGPKTFRATRIAWTIWRGGDPGDRLVLHRCDNPKCCNPDHLFIGTEADNSADMREKNRQGGQGSRCLKLSDEAVRQIRGLAHRISQRVLAEQFGVRQSTISRIKNGVRRYRVHA